MTAHPFETTRDGLYKITEPVDGIAPSEMELTYNGTTYRLSGYAGGNSFSRVFPDVILYENLEVVE